MRGSRQLFLIVTLLSTLQLIYIRYLLPYLGTKSIGLPYRDKDSYISPRSRSIVICRFYSSSCSYIKRQYYKLIGGAFLVLIRCSTSIRLGRLYSSSNLKIALYFLISSFNCGILESRRSLFLGASRIIAQSTSVSILSIIVKSSS